MKTLSLHDFYIDSANLARARGWRYGQAMVNNLAMVRPDLFGLIQETDSDPFYCSSSTDSAFEKFIQFLETNWYSTINGRR